MAPPKGGTKRRTPNKRPRRVGLLGIELAASSDDEDYTPAGAGGSGRRRSAASTSAAASQAAASRQSKQRKVDEEDVTLSQRSRQLQAQLRRVTAAGSPQAVGATDGPAAAAAAPTCQPPPDLPEEVLCNILRLACAPAMGGAIPTAAAAMCVSRAWRAAAQACPDLWQHTDLSWRRCHPTDAALARAAPRWRQLRHLSLAGVTGVSDASLQLLADSCPLLSSLSLAHCTQFSCWGLGAALSTMLLRSLAPDGSSMPLTQLDLSFIQVSPKVSGLDHVVREVLTQQARNPGGPVLQELVIEGCPLLTHQGLRALTEASVEQGRPLLAALTVLDLSQSAGARSDFAINIEKLQYSCPSLQQLRLNGLCGAYAWSFNAAPSQLPQGAPGPAFPQLRVCQVAAKSNPDIAGLGTGATNVNDACITRLLAQSPLLEELDVSGCDRLSPDCLATAVHPEAPLGHALLARSGACCDEAVAFLVDRFGATLEAVDLSWGGARITDAAAAALARCPRLHSVGLAGTAVTTKGVRALLLAADSHASAAAASAPARPHTAPASVAGATATAAVDSASAAKHTAAGSSKCSNQQAYGPTCTASGGGSSSSAHAAASVSHADRHSRQPFSVDVSSCRGLERGVRQAATQGMAQLRAALGLSSRFT